MEPGDPLLIYRNSQSKYTAAGRVDAPLWHTEWVRDEFWNGGPALDVFHVQDFEGIDLERKAVNRALDYQEDFWPQGLWRVADHRPVEGFLRRVGLCPVQAGPFLNSLSVTSVL